MSRLANLIRLAAFAAEYFGREEEELDENIPLDALCSDDEEREAFLGATGYEFGFHPDPRAETLNDLMYQMPDNH